MDILEVKIKKAENDNIIIGQTHFIKSVEDIYEAIKNIAPSGEFGIAFNEASTDRLIRYTGTNKEAMDCAIENCKEIAAGHIFCIVLKNIYPIQILNSIKAIPEVCNIFCATANEVSVIVAQNQNGRGIIGVIDGQTPVGIEDEAKKKERHDILRKFGYKQ
ncbi:MAG: adenosine-specific kinase [Exilispira sp.]|jgi:adenosine/AMP kinase|nr:adenosine-specific kinase [Exilispira sp.]